MFSVHSTGVAIALCFLTMIGWGSWVNTMKLAASRSWSFELFYWDYVAGMCGGSVLIGLTAGNYGGSGPSIFATLTNASTVALSAAFISGALFNLANVMVIIATDLAGIAIAFPVAAGPALILSTLVSYVAQPMGNPTLLLLGIALIIGAMGLSGYASRQFDRSRRAGIGKGLVIALSSGLLMGFFYPRLSSSIGGGNDESKLSTYAAALVFSLGLLASNLIVNSILVYTRKRTYREFFRAHPQNHLPGIAGGLIWMTALSANLVACRVAGPAVSYALGQGATLVAAFWGVFIWKEFRGASARVKGSLALMFFGYAGGLLLVGLAAL